MSEYTPNVIDIHPEKYLSHVTGNDVCFHCHSIGKKCTRLNGGFCRIGREEK